MYKSKKTNKAEKKLRRIGTRRILAMAAAALMAAGAVPQGTGLVQAKGTVLEETDTANNSSETFWSRLTAKAASFFGIGDDSKERSVDDHTVEGISPQGTTINLFDYWVNQRDSPDYGYNNDDGGINAGHQLKFTTGSSGSMNSWTGLAAPREGIVSNKLVNGYPQLSGSSELGMTRTESLDYLFNGNDVDSESEVAGKKAYTDVEGLLQVSDDGYYYYDSKQNFASFQEESNSFAIYDAPAVYTNEEPKNIGQFFPFNTAETVFNEVDGALEAKELGTQNNTIKHWFGLTMTSRFVQMDGGTTSKGAPVTYEFSGDDDVWIFIDNVLVGDLGGIHSAASVKIDFSTGEISINGESDGTLKSKFDAAGVSTDGWDENTFPDDSLHTLRFYYLERGNVDSNMSLKFNLVMVPESDIVKVDQTGNPVQGAEFALYTANEDFEVTNQTPVSTGITDSDGKIVLVDENDTLISFDELHNGGYDYFVLEETSVPEGYRKTGEMHLRYIASESTGNIGRGIVVSDNYVDTGAFANAKVSTTVSTDIQGIDGRSVPITDGKLERGTLFAVILHRKEGGDLEDSSSWYGISGSALEEWTTSKENGTNLAGVLETAKKNPMEFYLNSSGLYQVDIPELPGDIQYYYSMLADDEKEETEFAIGYYYTFADNIADAEEGNTFRLDDTQFSSQYAANFNIPDIKNRLLVQKLDQEGNPVSGAKFRLYNADDVTVNNDGSYQVRDGADSQEVTTEDLTKEKDGITMQGAAVYEGLSNGRYYLLESSAPKGYLLNKSITEVVVDDSGVYADAGEADDGIVTARGVGSLVQTMLQFATNDDMDTTFYNILASLQTQDTQQFDSSKGWSDTSQTMHLQYDADTAALEYVPGETDGAVQLSTDTGWSRLSIKQCYQHDANTDTSTKKNLGDTELSQLFSGTVTVQVTDIRSADLKISKTVNGYEGISDADLENLKDLSFTFQVTLEEEYEEGGTVNTRPLEGTWQIVNQNGEPILDADSKEIAVENGQAVFTLKSGQTAVIKDLPEGAKYQVTENSPGQGFTAQVESNDADADLNTAGTIRGDIKDLNPDISGLEEITADFTNTYSPAAVTVEGTDLSGTKTLAGKNWDDTDSYTFEITAVEPQTAPMPEKKTVTLNGKELTVSGNTPVSFNFGDITYTKPGTYIYNIKEQLPAGIVPGVSYSQASYRAVVTVTDQDQNGNYTGQLSASVSIVKEKDDTGAAADTPSQQADFTNTYNSDAANFVLLAQKNYDNQGNHPLTENMFSFVLSGKEGTTENGASIDKDKIPMPDETVNGICESGNNSTGAVFLGTLHFDQADVGNEYVYQVYEKQPTDDGTYQGSALKEGLQSAWQDPEKDNAWVYKGVTYDKEVKEITVSVTRDANNTIIVTAEYENTGDTMLYFDNTYTPDAVTLSGNTALQGEKTLTGRSMTAGEAFEFELTAANDAAETVLPAALTETVKDVEDGTAEKFSFKDLTFTETGTYIFHITEKLPDGVSAENPIKEGTVYDTHTTIVTVEVTDDQEGSLTAKVSYNNGSVSSETDRAVFSNTYRAVGSYNITGIKEISGRVFNGNDHFTFKIEALDNAPLPSGVLADGTIVITPKSGTKAAIDFGTVNFDKAGQSYSYILSEAEPADSEKPGGISYSKDTYKITITAKAGDTPGTLIPETVIVKNPGGDDETETDEIGWLNQYSASGTLEGAANLGGTKVLRGRDWTADDRFTFRLQGGNPMTQAAISSGKVILPAVTEKTVNSDDLNQGEAAFSFDDITFTKATDPGYPYIFQITENLPSGVSEDQPKKDGITYDTHKYLISVTVTDNGDGTLAVVSGPFSGSSTFTNVYSSLMPEDETAKTDITFTKELIGRDWTDTDAFTFSITALDNAPVPKDQDGNEISQVTVEKTSDSDVSKGSFGEIHYTYDMISGEAGYSKTFVYEISEVIPEDSGKQTGMNYDNSVYRVEITVTDDKKGTMTADSVIKKEKADGTYEEVNGVEFKNTYKALSNTLTPLKITKILSGGREEALQKDEFFFELSVTAVEGSPEDGFRLPAKTKLGNEADGSVQFDDIVFTEEGTYQVTVSEVKPASGVLEGVTYDDNVLTYTVTVKDNNGNLEAEISDVTGSQTFTNQYQASGTLNGAANLKVTKELSGRNWLDDDSFTFELSPGDEITQNAVKDKTVILPEDTKLQITGKDQVKEKAFGDITFTKAGTYKFQITEEEGKQAGITYDTVPRILTVKVTDNNDGTLTVAGTEVVENSLTFHNTYTAVPAVSENLTAEKTLTGRDMKDGEFSFSVTPQNQAPAPTMVSVKNTAAKNNETSELNFGRIIFTEAGKYTYLIKEEKGNLGGVSYDQREYTVTYIVTDNLKGNLEIESEVTLDGKPVDTVSFKNTYTSEAAEISGSADLSGTKTVVSEDPDSSYTMKGKEFEFEITALTKDAPLPEDTIVTNDAGGSFSFGNITYTAPGTYRYQISEVKGSAAGMSYDGSTYEVVVEVTDNGLGQLLASVSKSGDLEFRNHYNPEKISASISGTKSLAGRDLKDQEFSFRLEAGDDLTKKAVKEGIVVLGGHADSLITDNTQAGSFNFGQDAITFCQAGNYTFLVTEEKGEDANITYDDTVYEVKVNVTDDNGLLKAEWSKDLDIHFENTYTPFETEVSFGGTKTLDGRTIKDGEFKFIVTDAQGNEVSKGTNDAEGNIEFEPVVFTKAGEYYYDITEVNNAVGGIVYDTNLYHVKVVIDDVDGQLTAASVIYTADGGDSENGAVFKNVYRAEHTSVVLGAVKELEGRSLKDKEFTFVLKDENGKVIAEAQNDETGMILFEEIAFDKAGTYQYTVSEAAGTEENITYDETVYSITVTVEDNQEGYLSAAVDNHGQDIVFHNLYQEAQADHPKEDDSKTDQPGADKDDLQIEDTADAPATGDGQPVFQSLAVFVIAAAGILIAAGVIIRRRKRM